MTTTRTTRAAAALLGALVLVGASGARPAEAKDGDVKVAGRCTGRTTSKLKLGHRDGRIETEFEVDSNRNGQRWTVRITDNGVLVHAGTATTVAPSGSFEVRRKLANRAGVDRVQAVATNPATGERCTAIASA